MERNIGNSAYMQMQPDGFILVMLVNNWDPNSLESTQYIYGQPLKLDADT